MVLNAELKSI